MQSNTSLDDNSAIDVEQDAGALAAIQKLRSGNRKMCIIANLNINSLPNKFVEVREQLDYKALDILSIQETKIKRTFPDSRFQVNGYRLFRRDRVKGGGGIAIYVNDKITASSKKIACKSIDSLLLDLRISRQIALVCT